MVDARRLVEEIRGELGALEERIRRHPYIEALEGRRIGREKLALFAGQQRHIITSDLRSLSLIVVRAETPTAREFFLNGVMGEKAALEALGAFAKALGMTEDQLADVEPIPGAFAYSAFVTWLALYASPAEFAGAFLVNLEAWGANCGRMSRALTTGYGLKEADVAFFTLFTVPPSGFEEAALKVIGEGLSQGVDPKLIRRAARLLQGYELLYWDTMHQAST
ncbi:MAG: transcriptional regulator [candidate division NC10 bacterium]|nr:transcriptional regulator [candidate division NC10 bacterium]